MRRSSRDFCVRPSLCASRLILSRCSGVTCSIARCIKTPSFRWLINGLFADDYAVKAPVMLVDRVTLPPAAVVVSWSVISDAAYSVDSLLLWWPSR